MASVISVIPQQQQQQDDPAISIREDDYNDNDDDEVCSQEEDRGPTLPQHKQQLQKSKQGAQELLLLRAMKEASCLASKQQNCAATREGDEDDEDASSIEDEDDDNSPPANHAQQDHGGCCQGPACTDGHLSSCAVCGALPFRKSAPNITNALLYDDAAAWDWDGGLYDLIRQVNGQESHPKLPDEVTKATVESSTRHLNNLQAQLMKAGLQMYMDQKYTGESPKKARIIAPFDIKEIELGRILGSGGFSTVFEVIAFNPRDRINRRPFHPAEEVSRQYLKAHALLHPTQKALLYDKRDLTRGSRSKDEKGSGLKKDPGAKQQRLALEYPRYAVKHLRSNLVQKSAEKFKRAAIDLILEGQLLLILDHPHIISVRGWAADGPQAYSTGFHRDYFLILDRLATTLEDRMWDWRQKHIKYRARWRRRTARKRSGQQVSSWVRRRFASKKKSNKDETDQAPTPLDKYAVKLHGLLRERLRCAAGIASAIMYMHSKRLIHRDLKVSNIGFDAHNDVKLFDLGLSRLLPPPSKAVSQKDSNGGNDGDATASTLHDGYIMSRVGTKFYMAPEIRNKEPYTLSADVYSFGVVLWEILSLSSPRDIYHDRKTKLEQAKKRQGGGTEDAELTDLKQQMKDGCASWLPLCPCWPESLKVLISSSLSVNPLDRPTMEHVHAVLQEEVRAIDSDLRRTSAEPAEMSATAERRPTFRIDLTRTEGLHNLNFDEEPSLAPTATKDEGADGTESTLDVRPVVPPAIAADSNAPQCLAER
jgi:serine/threonine protein kinase